MFFDRLQAACDQKGVAMSTLLDKVNMSRGNIARWKSGLEPKAATKIKLADALGIERDELEEDGKADDISVLYKRLSSLCKESGITAYRMCKDTGIQPSIMTDLKMGRRQTVKAETAAKIAAYFGVSVDYLLGNDKKNKPATVGELTSDEIEYLRLYRGATKDARRLAELALKSDKPD